MRFKNAVLLAGLLLVGLSALGQTTLTVRICNEACKAGVVISQIQSIGAVGVIGTQIFFPPVVIPINECREFKFEVPATPTAVVVVYTPVGADTKSARAPVGTTTRFECGTILATVVAPPPPGVVPPVELPKELAGLGLSPGMAPEAVIGTLRGRGAEVIIQGTQTSPKYPDTDDPLIIGVLGSGFSVVGIWVGSGTGQLRSALVHDRPAIPVFLWVWGFPFWWNWCLAFPACPGALEVSCDCPGPGVIGTAPVPGSVFLVLIIKLGGPAMPYVLALSG